MRALNSSYVLNLLAVLLAVVTFMGCPQPIEREFKPLSDVIKRHTVFPEGSYWIYVDSTSGAIDSCAYSTMTLDTGHNSNDGPYEFEFARVYYHSSYYDYTLLGGATSEGIIDMTSFNIVIQVWFIEGERYRRGDDFVSEIVPGDEVYSCLYQAFHDTLTVKGIFYNNVKQFQVNDFMGEQFPKRVFFAPDIGIIKKETEDGKVWELDRYSVQ